MITRRKVRDGVIVSEMVSFDPNTTDAREWKAAFESMAAFQSARQRIEAHRAKAQQVIDDGATGRRLSCAKTAARLLDDAVGMLKRKDAEGAVYNVITAMECLWVTDVKQVEPEIITGAGSRSGSRKGNARKTATASERKAAMQAEANEIWMRHRAWSSVQVARHIRCDLSPLEFADDDKRADYIRRRIRRPAK